jgi:hypothetical protein
MSALLQRCLTTLTSNGRHTDVKEVCAPSIKLSFSFMLGAQTSFHDEFESVEGSGEPAMCHGDLADLATDLAPNAVVFMHCSRVQCAHHTSHDNDNNQRAHPHFTMHGMAARALSEEPVRSI